MARRLEEDPRFLPILLKALSTKPDSRYPDSAALADALEGFTTACGREDPRQRLAALMTSLFGDRRARKHDAIAGVRAAASAASEPPKDVSILAVTSTSSRPIVPPPRGNLRIVLGAALTAMVVLAAVFVLRSPHGVPAQQPRAAPIAPAPPLPASSAAPAVDVPRRAVLELVVEPPVAASIEVDGTMYSGPKLRLEREISDAPVVARVRASGFQETSVELLPDRDRSTTVVLARAEPEPVPEKSPPRPTASTRSRKSGDGSKANLGDLLNRRY